LDRSIESDLEQLTAAGPEPDSVYKCPNLACQWRGTEPLNTQSNRGGRKHLEIRCPECTAWIRGGFAEAGSDIVLWPPQNQEPSQELEYADATDAEFTLVTPEETH
jgi:hypothetical protein